MTYYTMRQAGDVLDCLDIAPGQSRRLGVYQKVGRPLPDALVAACAVGAHEAKQAAERGSLREHIRSNRAIVTHAKVSWSV